MFKCCLKPKKVQEAKSLQEFILSKNLKLNLTLDGKAMRAEVPMNATQLMEYQKYFIKNHLQTFNMVILVDQNLLKDKILDEILSSLKKKLNSPRLNLRLAIMHENFTFLDAVDNNIKTLQDRVSVYQKTYKDYILKFSQSSHKMPHFVRNSHRVLSDFILFHGQITHLNVIVISHFKYDFLQESKIVENLMVEMIIFNQNEKFEKVNMERIKAMIKLTNVKNKYRYFQKCEKNSIQNKIYEMLDNQSKMVMPVQFEHQTMYLNLNEDGNFKGEILMEDTPIIISRFHKIDIKKKEYSRSDKEIILLKLSNIKVAISNFASCNPDHHSHIQNLKYEIDYFKQVAQVDDETIQQEMKDQAFWAKDLVQILTILGEQLDLVQNIHRQINISKTQSEYQKGVLLELVSNIGYRFWQKPQLEKVLSPILENAEAENMKTELSESDPTLEDSAMQSSQLTIHQTPLNQKVIGTNLDQKAVQPLVPQSDPNSDISMNVSETPDIPCNRAKLYSTNSLNQIQSKQKEYTAYELENAKAYNQLQEALNDKEAFEILSKITGKKSYVDKNLEMRKCQIEAQLSRVNQQ